MLDDFWKGILTFMNTANLTTWLEIDLSQLQNNLNELKKMTGKPVMAVVKANAYGHGLVDIALAAEAAGTPWCGVARLEEALALRQGGVKTNILVLGYTPPGSAVLAALEGISLTVYDRATAQAYSAAGLESGKPLNVHLKIDSGMGRLGVFANEGVDMAKYLRSLPGIHFQGMFTHFARADEPELNTTDQQLEKFASLVKQLEEINLRPEYVHASNSGGTLAFKDAWFDFVRPGIALYGLSPSSKALVPPTIKPILSWKTRLISVKELPAGHGVGYGHRYVVKTPEKIGVLAIGYADGFRRVPGNEVIINGKRVPVLGSVCMDQCMVQLEDVPDAKIGDEVVIIGQQGGEVITADDIAARWGTINYEVVAGVAARVARVYKSA